MTKILQNIRDDKNVLFLEIFHERSKRLLEMLLTKITFKRAKNSSVSLAIL